MPETIVEKPCLKCKQVKPISEFRTRTDTKSLCYRPTCNVCSRIDQRQYNATPSRRRYEQSDKRKHGKRCAMRRFRKSPGNELYFVMRARQYRRQYPERERAMSAVNVLVRAGKIPRATTLYCLSCYHPAQVYHHYAGYSPEAWYNVIPMCRSCHKHIHTLLAGYLLTP